MTPAAVLFFVVKPVTTLMARRQAGEVPEADVVPEHVALSAEVRDLLKVGPGYAAWPSRPT